MERCQNTGIWLGDHFQFDHCHHRWTVKADVLISQSPAICGTPTTLIRTNSGIIVITVLLFLLLLLLLLSLLVLPLLQMGFVKLFVGCVFIRMTLISAGYEVALNLSDFKQHRHKRGLIFEGGGKIKFVIGPVMPVILGDLVNWRGLICTVNMHVGDYTIPTQPLYPWDKWENIYARRMASPAADGSHELLYTFLEQFLGRGGKRSGRSCLLRSICENAQVDHHVGLLAEILNVFLTPGRENIDAAYKEAMHMGRSGVDCVKYYSSCPKGDNLLDQFVDEL